MKTKKQFASTDVDSKSIFERLLLLPLFQGLSVDDLMRMVECARFEFRTEGAYEVLFRQNHPVSSLSFILQGELLFECRYPDNIRAVEFFFGPMALLPQCLFGKTTVATHTIIANTDVSLLEISKQEVLSQLMNFYVFRLSVLNYFSTIAQESNSRLMQAPVKIGARLVAELQKFFASSYGKKELYIGMQQLADRLYVSRRSISKTLRSFEGAGLLTLTRGCIHIPSFENLVFSVKE
jgi:CRP-like cAMP-binding protein